MNCCPSADFNILPNGIEAKERNVQSDTTTSQFFPFSRIVSISYSHSREDGGMITIFTKTIPYRYHFPCSDSGKEIYGLLVAALP